MAQTNFESLPDMIVGEVSVVTIDWTPHLRAERTLTSITWSTSGSGVSVEHVGLNAAGRESTIVLTANERGNYKVIASAVMSDGLNQPKIKMPVYVASAEGQ